MTIDAPRPGDRIISKRPDGLCDVIAVTDEGEATRRDDGLQETIAAEIADANKADGGHVWVRHHSTPEITERYRLPKSR